MKRDKPTNLPASIRQRLLDRAKKRGEDYNYTLSQYAIERFLYGWANHRGVTVSC